MARGNTLRASEGVAVDGKWALGKERSLKYRIVRMDKSVSEGESKYFGLMRDDGSPERIAELDRLREQSEIKVPVFRGQPAYETLDKAAMKEALKKSKEGLDWRQKKRDVFYGGGGMFHFSADIDHASDYGHAEDDKQGGVIEGVLIAKSMLDLRKIGSEPDGFGGDIWDSKVGEVVRAKEVIPKFPKPEPRQLPSERMYVNGKDWGGGFTDEYKNWRKEKESWEEEKSDFLHKFYAKVNDGGVYSVGYASYDRNDYDNPKWGKSIDEKVRVASYIDNAVKTIADAYQAKFGKPMPQDIFLKKGEASAKNSRQRELLKRNDYAALRNAIWTDKRFARGPYAYLLMQTTPFKEMMKKAKFDSVAYMDIMHHGDQLESFAVMKPNQFKAYAGDKKVNLKSDNMFDA